jgi:hypothetical protein
VVRQTSRTTLTPMAGRVANEEQGAIFRPYSGSTEAQKAEAAKVAGKDATALEPPIGEDMVDSSGPVQGTSKKKKKRKKKPSVSNYVLSLVGDCLT